MPEEQPKEVRYLTDDRDRKDRQLELVVFLGGCDWYLGVVKKGEGAIGKCVRISTSGGATSNAPGLPTAIADAFRAIANATPGHGVSHDPQY